MRVKLFHQSAKWCIRYQTKTFQPASLEWHYFTHEQTTKVFKMLKKVEDFYRKDRRWFVDVNNIKDSAWFDENREWVVPRVSEISSTHRRHIDKFVDEGIPSESNGLPSLSSRALSHWKKLIVEEEVDCYISADARRDSMKGLGKILNSASPKVKVHFSSLTGANQVLQIFPPLAPREHMQEVDEFVQVRNSTVELALIGSYWTVFRPIFDSFPHLTTLVFASNDPICVVVRVVANRAPFPIRIFDSLCYPSLVELYLHEAPENLVDESTFCRFLRAFPNLRYDESRYDWLYMTAS